MTTISIAPAALKPEDAARYLSLSRRAIYTLIEKKELKPRKVGRTTLLRVRDLDAFLNRETA